MSLHLGIELGLFLFIFSIKIFKIEKNISKGITPLHLSIEFNPKKIRVFVVYFYILYRNCWFLGS